MFIPVSCFNLTFFCDVVVSHPFPSVSSPSFVPNGHWAPDRNLTNTFNRKNEVILRFAKHHTLLLASRVKLGRAGLRDTNLPIFPQQQGKSSLYVLARIILRVLIHVKICTSRCDPQQSGCLAIESFQALPAGGAVSLVPWDYRGF